MSNKKEEKTELVRGLTLTAAIMIVVGTMIGSGIFRKPASMAEQLMSPELLILAWVVAGIISLIGALVFAEAAGMIDKTGGQYSFFQKMYGNFTAYIYGWSVIAVIQTGAQAAIAYVFAEYLGYFISYPELSKSFQEFNIYFPFVGEINPFFEFGTKTVAMLAIIFLTGINYVGVVLGGIVQIIITYAKIISITILSILLLTFGNGSISNLVYSPADFSSEYNIITLFGLAMVGAFWAYDGWSNVTYVAGEVKEPKKNIPKALVVGTLIVIGIYVLINLAYLYILPIEEMAVSPLVAATAMEKVFGSYGGTIISILVIVSTFGALNGSLLASARVPFIMGRDKIFFNVLGKVHPKFGTPHIALLTQGLWASVLCYSGTFDIITNYVMFASWLFYMMAAIGIFILRKKEPDNPRPYKVWVYPITPIIFISFSFLFLLNTLISDTENAMKGLILIFLGLPVYFYHKFSKKG